MALSSTALPTIEQLSSDPFMKQMAYGSEIVSLLGDNETDEKLLSDMIAAQLSHSDGIRGFFVTYLTGEGPSPADSDEMPKPLMVSIQQIEDKRELISLACMNVIMPTGMITMHTDEDLSKSSALTAMRGKIVARSLMEENEMKEQCAAILAVATDVQKDSDDKNVKYWIQFFEKWGYGPKQKEAIAAAVKDLLLAQRE